jgi:hypothetical protein
MSVYDKISKKIGRQNWNYNIFHDDGNVESDGGGKSCAYLAPPGKGKSTLMAQAAQFVRSVIGDSKKSYISHVAQGKDCSHFTIEPETVLWRLREFDNFASLIPPNWINSYPNWGAEVKPVHVFVHELDNPLFFSIQNNTPVTPTNMVPIERYHDAQDLMGKIHWNAINCILEPQTYRLSKNLIFALQKHKMDDDPDAEPEPDKPKYDPDTGEPIKQKKKKKKQGVDYSKKFVDPAYFWYDLLDITYRNNNRRHVTFFIDEFHDVAEADCEGDAWKLASILATKTYPQFRKNNVSLHLSTHQLSFVDYRIVKRIEYINWFRGAKIAPNHSMISLQALLSNLNIGQLITEETNIQFGIMTFDKIHNAPPQVYIAGLLGQNPSLKQDEWARLLDVQKNLAQPDYFKVKAKSLLPEVIEI